MGWVWILYFMRFGDFNLGVGIWFFVVFCKLLVGKFGLFVVWC